MKQRIEIDNSRTLAKSVASYAIHPKGYLASLNNYTIKGSNTSVRFNTMALKKKPKRITTGQQHRNDEYWLLDVSIGQSFTTQDNSQRMLLIFTI